MAVGELTALNAIARIWSSLHCSQARGTYFAHNFPSGALFYWLVG